MILNGALRRSIKVGSAGLYCGNPDSAQARVDGQQTAFTRLAVLKAAAEFAASRPALKSGDVLAIAERWEQWVGRGPGMTASCLDKPNLHGNPHRRQRWPALREVEKDVDEGNGVRRAQLEVPAVVRMRVMAEG